MTEFCLGSGQSWEGRAAAMPNMGTFLGLLNTPQQGAEPNQAIS